MKKILGISLVAVLTAMPLMAFAGAQDNAEDCATAGGEWNSNFAEGKQCSFVTTTDPGATTANAPEAANAPKYALKAAAETDGNVATAGYVKGAYNAAIKAINKVAEDSKDGVVNTIKHATITNTSSLGVSSTLSGSATVPVMDDWSTDQPNTNGITISTSGMTINNTVTGGVTSTISVDDYYTTAPGE